ncbi:MAG TPA: beta-eliminating lyase-related protein [Polyangia bacterium]|nr:beta-eliminating lyase-related protein [Polyangia bacterium]
MSRRGFLKTGAACAVVAASPPLVPAAFAAPGAPEAQGSPSPPEGVHFLFDGLDLKPPDYAQLLPDRAKAGGAGADIYLSGGAVEQLEARMAALLGKERAVFIPTGTLANHLAIRRLTSDRTRAIVPAESHIYNDSFDCVETLSHLNLIPLGPGQATFKLAQVEQACRQAVDGPFPVPVGAIAIESPIRRQNGAVFDFEEMKRISAWARNEKIGLHLDGARLLIACAYTGIAPAAYAALFDTVYVSLYKYLNAGAGAILAGPREVIEKVAHDRKVFGGGLASAWPYAAVALYYLDGFVERFRKAIEAAEALWALLGKHPRFKVEKIPGGTNVYKLRVQKVDAARYRMALARGGIRVGRAAPGPDHIELLLFINETMNRRAVPELARVFTESLSAA